MILLKNNGNNLDGDKVNRPRPVNNILYYYILQRHRLGRILFVNEKSRSKVIVRTSLCE